MNEANPEAVCAEVSGTVLMAHMREFARWTKLSGTPDEMTSLRYVQRALDGYGLSTSVLMHDAYISLPGRSRVEIDATAPRSITHSFSRPSSEGGLNGEVVYLNEGTEADFAARDVRGRIVLVEGIASPAVSRRATLAGAVGQLHISPHEHIHEMCVSPVWGSPTADLRAELPGTVVNSIALEDGARLRAALARGERPRVVLHAEVDTGWRPTPILVAELDPPNAPADAPFVLFSGHHDTWYYGVMDNGGANATMLEVARLAALHRGDLQRGLRLCFWSGHSHGRYSGSAWYADEYWTELDRRCVAHVNVDSTGGIGATVLANGAAMPQLAPLAAEALHVQAGARHVGRPMDRSSDQSFWGVGLPSMLGSLSEQPPGPVKLRNRLGWWWHTPEDTLDKIDEANLVRDTRVFMHVLWRLLADRVAPLDYTAWGNQLAAALDEIGGEPHGIGLSELSDAARRIADKSAALRQLDADRANAALLRLSRLLVPLHTLTGDRFTHDPALPQPPWPALAAVQELAAAAPGSDAARFRAAGARRARNRLAHALCEANALVDAATR